MNTITSLTDLFHKLDELKTVFRYGERLIPILQSLIDFMSDTVPLLENINLSIAESTSKIPKATHQIHDITSATELATTEILDTIDVISTNISSADATINALIKSEREKKELVTSLTALAGNTPEAEALARKYDSLTNVEQTLVPLTDLFEKTRSNVYNISLSLQVQDITAQQLAAVNHLIESVQEKLSALIIDFEVSNVAVMDTSPIKVPVHTTFDPNARYSKSDEQQNMADALIKDQASRASQDEIDKIFS